MAEIVEFKVINSDPYEYAAIVQGKYDPSWDNSGVFVRESDYAALLERHRKAIKVLQNINERCRVLPYRLAITPCLHDAMDAALSEEVDDGPVDNHRS
jgi:hypothetical protein